MPETREHVLALHTGARPLEVMDNLRSAKAGGSGIGSSCRGGGQARLKSAHHAWNVRLDLKKVFEGQCRLIDGHAAAVERAATLQPRDREELGNQRPVHDP